MKISGFIVLLEINNSMLVKLNKSNIHVIVQEYSTEFYLHSYKAKLFIVSKILNIEIISDTPMASNQ
jgi:hypothetical protein